MAVNWKLVLSFLCLEFAVVCGQDGQCLAEYRSCAQASGTYLTGPPGKMGAPGPPGPACGSSFLGGFGGGGQCDCQAQINNLKAELARIQAFLNTRSMTTMPFPQTTRSTTTTPMSRTTRGTTQFWMTTTRSSPAGSGCVRTNYLGTEYRGTLPDSAFSASSFSDRTKEPHDGRLNHPQNAKSWGGWLPKSPYLNSWIQVDLGERKTITAVLTQGNAGWNFYVTKFTFKYGDNLSSLKHYTTGGFAGAPKEFIANDSGGNDIIKENRLTFPISARYIRLYPTAWQGGPFMRFGVKGC